MKEETFLDVIKDAIPDIVEDIPTTGFIDTGSYALNAYVSGSLYKGFPDNKISMFHGSAGTGKTFFCLSAIKAFLDQYPDGWIVYFDTEYAIDKDFFAKRGICADNIIIIQPDHLQHFRENALKILDTYSKTPIGERKKLMMVLDSLGNLPTKKEVDDSTSGNDVRDMTKAQVIRSIFRTITSRMGKLNVSMPMANHSYEVIGCLDNSQSILMSDDTLKNIASVEIGDSVKTLEGVREVTELYQYDVDHYIEIVTDEGNVIKATPNHKFLVWKDGFKMWIPAEDLDENMEFVTV